MDVYMIDVHGDRVCIARKKYQYFRNAGTDPTTAWLWRPRTVSQLWSGSRHHSLTHALRLFQVCSCTFEGHHRRSEERMLRGNIQPERLLRECGASASQSTMLVTLLVEEGLLRSQNGSKKGLSWFINMRTRGLGPTLQKYDADELPEMVLPEFITSPPAPLKEKEGEEMPKEPVGTEALSLLTRVYLAVREHVPEGAETVDGFALFIPETDLKVLLARQLDQTAWKSGKLLEQLSKLGVYKSESGGRGKPWRRFLKLDAEEIVAAAKDGSKRRRPAARRLEPADAPPAKSAEELEGVPASPEQLNQLWAQLSTKLDEYAEEITDLQRQLSEERAAHNKTKEELAALKSKPSGPVFVIPEELAKHLKN